MFPVHEKHKYLLLLYRIFEYDPLPPITMDRDENMREAMEDEETDLDEK